MNKKGVTLIELLAVLVVLAILALISIPITIRIINNARENSYKRSIAAYGSAVESYIGEYLSDHSIDYNDITYDMIKDDIKLTGNNVTCDNLAFEDNGDIVLGGCHVGDSKMYKYINRQVIEEKEYQKYEIGNEITVAGADYYIIEDSTKNQDYVVALKIIPLTTSEINDNGAGYINTNTLAVVDTANVINIWGTNIKLGGVAYYSSDTCGYPRDGSGGQRIESGCQNNYDDSQVKPIIDNWAKSVFKNEELKSVNNYEARLIKIDELERLGYVKDSNYYPLNNNVPSLLYHTDYCWYTMSPYNSSNSVWTVQDGRGGYLGQIRGRVIMDEQAVVRPVINVFKDKITKKSD